MPSLRVLGIVAVFLFTFSVSAQQQISDLAAENVQLVNSVGDFNQPVIEAVGQLSNSSRSHAYTNITLNAQAFDAQGKTVGEGIGVLVNACGDGLLPDFTLQPGDSQTFSAPLELDDPNAKIARVEISATADSAALSPSDPLPNGMQQITDDETVNVEWVDNNTFHYSTGCDSDLFLNWDWYSYDIQRQSEAPINTPFAENVTDTLRSRLQLSDDATFAHSMMRFAPDGQRVVYQNEKNDFLTAYIDGTYRRGLYTGLNNRSLQGIYWQPDEKFLAYYYGSYGDPVYYFTADAEARIISPPLEKNPPSVIVPGVSRDGRRVVVAGQFDQGVGYYLYVVTNGFFEFEFQANPPGNNFPAPIPLTLDDDDSGNIDLIYAALPVDGTAHLQCFNRDEAKLYDLGSLPINLSDGDRAWWWLSPDNSRIALAANGVNGGLWLIDLTALPACSSS